MNNIVFTPEEYRAVLRADLRTFAERSFLELNPESTFLDSAYIASICSRLDAVMRGEVRRLIINLPPRSLKSHCASIAFPAWVLGHYPSHHMICASYGQHLADKLARDCRSVMQTRWYQELFPTRLQRETVHDLETTASGTRRSTSVGGVLTGLGADLILLDDPLKPDEALSETSRNGVNSWYSNSLLSRLNDKQKGAIVIVMQRLHQDDLVGHVLQQGDWEVLSFPAIAEEDQMMSIPSVLKPVTYRRRQGEALHPEREPLSTLNEIRQTIGEYNFLSQYQQNPQPPGGAMIKAEWLRYYKPGEEPGQYWQKLQSWDTANKASELNDYSVCTTWGHVDDRFYLLDVFRKRLNYPELKRAVIEQAQRHSVNTVVIEDKASGIQLIQDLQYEGRFMVKGYKAPPGADKIMRLHAQSLVFESGRVWLPEEASWLHDYQNELISFPGTKFDDQVDSTTQALDYLREHDVLSVWARL